MATYSTFAEARTAYLASTDWEVEQDVAKAKVVVSSINAMIAFAEAASQGGGQGSQSFNLNFQQLVNEKTKALAFVQANATPSDAQRQNNPDVTHADWSGFHNYR